MRLSWIALVFCVAACAALNTTIPEPSVTTQHVPVRMPTIAALDPAQENQEQDGVRVIASAVPFNISNVLRCDYRFVPAILRKVAESPVDRREHAVPSIEPDAFRFKVRINNRLPRVLRLAGTAVAFQVSGRNVNVPQDRYADFLNGIVLPQQETELELSGPTLAEIIGDDMKGLPGDSATIALLLFDVVTETDGAGNPTKRANFQYFYKFNMPERSVPVTTTVRRLALPGQWYDFLSEAQGGDLNQWIANPELDRMTSCGDPARGIGMALSEANIIGD